MYEPGCTVKVDEWGFFIYWKSEGRVSNFELVLEFSTLSLSNSTVTGYFISLMDERQIVA